NLEARNTLLQKAIPGYPVLEYANQHQMGRIYLFSDLLNALYYAPHPIWGDVFGPWRYRDIVSNDPVKFANELSRRNFDAVIIDGSFREELEANPALRQHFSLVFENSGVGLYRLKKQ
ncbi:MAG: hypothetical protein ACYC5X_14725, partial [Syntrophales bacterium]